MYMLSVVEGTKAKVPKAVDSPVRPFNFFFFKLTLYVHLFWALGPFTSLAFVPYLVLKGTSTIHFHTLACLVLLVVMVVHLVSDLTLLHTLSFLTFTHSLFSSLVHLPPFKPRNGRTVNPFDLDRNLLFGSCRRLGFRFSFLSFFSLPNNNIHIQ